MSLEFRLRLRHSSWRESFGFLYLPPRLRRLIVVVLRMIKFISFHASRLKRAFELNFLNLITSKNGEIKIKLRINCHSDMKLKWKLMPDLRVKPFSSASHHNPLFFCLQICYFSIASQRSRGGTRSFFVLLWRVIEMDVKKQKIKSSSWVRRQIKCEFSFHLLLESKLNPSGYQTAIMLVGLWGSPRPVNNQFPSLRPSEATETNKNFSFNFFLFSALPSPAKTIFFFCSFSILPASHTRDLSLSQLRSAFLANFSQFPGLLI